MEQLTSILHVAIASLGKKRNEDIMSLDIIGVRSLGGPSKRMRQSMRKIITEAPEGPNSTTVDII